MNPMAQPSIMALRDKEGLSGAQLRRVLEYIDECLNLDLKGVSSSALQVSANIILERR